MVADPMVPAPPIIRKLDFDICSLYDLRKSLKSDERNDLPKKFDKSSKLFIKLIMIKKLKFKNPLNDLNFNYEVIQKKIKDKNLYSLSDYRKRTMNARNLYVPFILSHYKKINNVLEIGAGYGSVTFSLSSYCKNIDIIEIDKKAKKFLKESREYFPDINILDYDHSSLKNLKKEYDAIIFSASLEHMTLEERKEYLSISFKILSKKGFLFILECPNTYWFKDDHSTRLLFNNWLPYEIGFLKTKQTPRDSFKDLYFEYSNPSQRNHWHRRGRPVSKDELEIFLNIDLKENYNLNSLNEFLGIRFYLRLIRYGLKYNLFRTFLKILKVPEAFSNPFFTISIKK